MRDVARKGSEVNRFVSRVSQSARFKELLKERNNDESYFTEICQLCWDVHLEDLARVQRRMDDINLNSMRQISSLREQVKPGRKHALAGSTDSELVEFYEPLKFLDESTQALVCSIVREKLTQLASQGSAPAKLMAAIGPLITNDSSEWKIKIKKLEEQLEESQREVGLLQLRLEDARDEKEQLKKIIQTKEKELKECRAQIEELQIEIDKLKGELIQAQRAIAKLTQENQRLEEEKAALQQEMERLREQMRELEAELERVKHERAVLKEKLAAAEKEIEQLNQQIAVLDQQINNL